MNLNGCYTYTNTYNELIYSVQSFKSSQHTGNTTECLSYNTLSLKYYFLTYYVCELILSDYVYALKLCYSVVFTLSHKLYTILPVIT